MAMEFRLLGEVEALAGGRRVDIGHARQRCVLAVLLIDANRAVSVDQLVDRVWGQQAPQQARKTLYVYVSQLRQALAVSDEARIIREPPGYLLSVDPLGVDLHRFLQLTEQARAATTAVEALALLEQALGLWRGEAFDALDTPWLATVRADLHRQRLAAELDRNDLALDQGRHTELLAPLETTAAQYPLDERLAGQLMLAMYRSGRQADALDHYHRLRLRLAEELGVDPNPELQQLHQRMLATDPVLAAPVSVVGRSASDTMVPRQLPAGVAHFAGRDGELATLTNLLRGQADSGATVVISAVSGTAGVGKTALAVHWAHQVAEQFPDGQLYVNLRGFDPTGSVMEPAEAVRRFLDALAVPPQRIPVDLDAQAALYRSQLAGKRTLIVLDNARDTAQVQPLLPGAPGSLVLITSRNQLTGLIAVDAAHPITLDLLTDDEARQLLAQRLGAARMAAEPAAVTEIITRCAHLPLALALVAARAALQPHTELHRLADELRDTQHRWQLLSGDDPSTDVRAVFSWSYQALSPPAARLFRLLGLHPGPDLAAPAAASLAGLPASTVQPLLGELTRASLLVEHTPGRYTLHDLLRAYATHLTHTTDPEQHRLAAIHRILDHYLHTAHTANRLLEPARDPVTLTPAQPGVTPQRLADHQQALDWFATERPILLATIDHAAATSFDTHVWQLAWTLWIFLDRRGHWHDQAAIGRAAVAAAHRLADPSVQIHVHRFLAGAYILLGRFDDAHTQLRQALDLATRTSDQPGQAYAHRSLGYLWGHRGNYPQALDHARQALHLFQGTDHQLGQAAALNQVGWFHAVLGEHQQAITCCQRAFTVFQDLGDRDGQAHALDSIGYAHHHLGHYTQALTSYQHALDLARDLGDRYLQATILTHLGDTHHTTDNRHAAHTAWRQALTILDDLHHPDADQLRTKLATHNDQP